MVVCQRVRVSISTTLLQRYIRSTVNPKSTATMKVLNVAEKNDVAKRTANFLSNGACRTRNGFSVFNKIYDFNYTLWGEVCNMIMTSVSGHLLNHEFSPRLGWESCHPSALFDATVKKECKTDRDSESERQLKIKRTLEREVKACSALIIWTDCDREGENIGYEIIDVCTAIKPNIKIYRAKFSEVTSISVTRAIRNLIKPDKNVSDAVEVRSELDLRIGAAFTRFQTMFLREVFPKLLGETKTISYGSCQFPTLGFIVERYLAIEAFVPEPYWKLKVKDVRDNATADFFWGRHRLFEKEPCEALLDECLDDPQARVKKVLSKPKTKFRPLPLDTVELQKQCTRKLRIGAKRTLAVAEKLYTQGLISYPRTETNIFPKELDLMSLVRQHVVDDNWGNFAQRLTQAGLHPRQGKKSDDAHPPIHPTKYIGTLQGEEAKIYEYIVRHFLACLSSNAEGQETIVEIDLAGEKFTAKGLQVIAKNYLEVYIYEKWGDKTMPLYREGQVFHPTEIKMVEEVTSAPNLLTEADLIALMEKHGIGTDATHAEHIETLKNRLYAYVYDSKYLVPGQLGIGLITGYDNAGLHMSKPYLRAELERDLKLICEGKKNALDVLQAEIGKYRHLYKEVTKYVHKITESLAKYLDVPANQVKGHKLQTVEQPVFKCPRCNCTMSLKTLEKGSGKKFIGCMAQPFCSNAIWFPCSVQDVEILNEICSRCPIPIYKLKFTLNTHLLPHYPKTYETCIGGCDPSFNEDFAIPRQAFRNIARPPSNNTGGRTVSTTNNVQIRSNDIRVPERVENESTDQRSYRNDRGESSKHVRQNPGLSPMEPPRKRLHVSQSNTGARNETTIKTEDTPTWGRIDENVDLMCNCHEVARRYTVSKEGPTKGRLFFKCARPPESRCDFFMWGTDGPSQSDTTHSNASSSLWNNGSSNISSSTWSSDAGRSNPLSRDSRVSGSQDDASGSTTPNCYCGKPAQRKTTMKEGPNKGRQFYGCHTGIRRACQFFKWADEDNSGSQTYKPVNKKPSWGKGVSRQGSSGRQRKCGICGQEGHTRKTCTQNVMD